MVAMQHFLFRISLLAAAFAFVVALAAAPSGVNPARTFFAASGCPMPCWNGIRPGITLRADAEAILAAHPWLSLTPDVRVPGVAYSGTYDLWTWTDAFPFPMPINRPDIAFTDGVIGYLDRQVAGVQARVGGIEMTTGLRLADVWRLLGAPQSIVSEGYVGVSGERLHEIRLLAFGGHNINATAYQACPITFESLLESPVILHLSPNAPPALPHRPMLPTLYALLRLREISVCG
jgi:hypothetical protein